MNSVFLITGLPGTGKTSLIKQALASFQGIKAGGFLTEEIRLQGVREGFRVVTIDGKTASLANVNIHSQYRVSKYGVDINSINGLAVSVLQQAFEHCDLVVIDEIGKMELFSEQFKSIVLEIIESGKSVLGTIMLKSNPWADMIKQKSQISLLTLTRYNQEEALEKVLKWLNGRFVKV
jgi:nucleoside-triphosphatase